MKRLSLYFAVVLTITAAPALAFDIAFDWSGQKTIEPGAFKYESPCPPSGPHTYEWTATAQSSKSSGKLGTAKAKRKYSE